MKNATKKISFDDARERGRLEYLLGRRELELEALKEELKGEREVNSLCAAYMMYLLLNEAKEKDGVLCAEVSKAAVNALIGRYFAACEDTGEAYKVIFTERTCAVHNEGENCGS